MCAGSEGRILIKSEAKSFVASDSNFFARIAAASLFVLFLTISATKHLKVSKKRKTPVVERFVISSFSYEKQVFRVNFCEIQGKSPFEEGY